MGSLSITWELVRNVDSGPTPDLLDQTLHLTESPGVSCAYPSLRKTNLFHMGPNRLDSLSESLAKLRTFLDLVTNSLNLNYHGWPRAWYFPPIFYLKTSKHIETLYLHTHLDSVTSRCHCVSSHIYAFIHPLTHLTF